MPSVQEHYGAIAMQEGASCCAPSTTHYTAAELAALPEGAHLGLGTGNPVREAAPREGEVVLDLGSGAGIDVFLAARAVGPRGRAIGIDVTPEMVARARRLAREAGIGNVAFHESPIERLPVENASVDVITSNCVVNLSEDKDAVLREAFRALRSGGRLVVSDTLRMPWTPKQEGPPACDCSTGAMSAGEWRRGLARAGFVDVHVRMTSAEACCDPATGSAMITARKP